MARLAASPAAVSGYMARWPQNALDLLLPRFSRFVAALKAVTPRGIGVRPSSGWLLNLNTYDLDRFILLRLSERLVPRPPFFDFPQ
jgi:hypothetical protein